MTNLAELIQPKGEFIDGEILNEEVEPNLKELNKMESRYGLSNVPSEDHTAT